MKQLNDVPMTSSGKWRRPSRSCCWLAYHSTAIWIDFYRFFQAPIDFILILSTILLMRRLYGKVLRVEPDLLDFLMMIGVIVF